MIRFTTALPLLPYVSPNSIPKSAINNLRLLITLPDIEQVQTVKNPLLPLTTLPQDEAHFREVLGWKWVRVERLDHLGLIASVIND